MEKILPYLIPILLFILTLIGSIVGFFIRNSFQETKDTLKEILHTINKITLDFAELKGKHENNSLAIEFLKKEFDDFKKEIKILEEKIIKLEKN